MASTGYLGIPLLSNNQSAKEATINDAIAYLENSAHARYTLNFSAGDIVLPALDAKRAFMYVATGVNAPRNLTVPYNLQRVFAIDNSGGANTITVVQGGNTLTIKTGEIYVIFCNGTVMKFLYNSEGLGTTHAFPFLSDVPNSYSGSAGFFLKVNSSETGLEFTDPGAGLISFLNLTDSPLAYTGAGKGILQVKSTEDGVEFVTKSSILGVQDWVDELTNARTLSSADIGKYIRTQSASPTTITVPTGGIPSGGIIHIRQANDGEVTIVPATSGVVVNTPQTLVLAGRNATATLIKLSNVEWDLFGALKPL